MCKTLAEFAGGPIHEVFHDERFSGVLDAYNSYIARGCGGGDGTGKYGDFLPLRPGVHSGRLGWIDGDFVGDAERKRHACADIEILGDQCAGGVHSSQWRSSTCDPVGVGGDVGSVDGRDDGREGNESRGTWVDSSTCPVPSSVKPVDFVFDGASSVPAGVGVRGPNYARNRAARERRRNRAKPAVEGGCDTGFWNSCSSAVKQELIDSKARMHIAENNERIRKCKMSEDKDSSVETLIRNIVRISELQRKMASVPNEKIVGWVNNVVSGEVETMASSAPSSVPSFDQLSAKLAASSQSSFELSIKAKDDELQRKNEEIAALKRSLQAECAKDDELIVAAEVPFVPGVVPRVTSASGGVRASGVKFGDSGKRKISRSRYAHVDFATVKPNPMPMTPERLKQWNDNHISLTRAQVYEE